MNKHGFKFVDRPEKEDCPFCAEAAEALKKLNPEIPEDIVRKIRAVCPKCGRLDDREAVSRISRELKEYFQKFRKDTPRQKCAVCGKTGQVAISECCGKPMCVNASKRSGRYRNKSCYEGHSRYTVCSTHHAERHPGEWKDCKKCRKMWETEMYVWYGTNGYNVEKLRGRCRSHAT